MGVFVLATAEIQNDEEVAKAKASLKNAGPPAKRPTTPGRSAYLRNNLKSGSRKLPPSRKNWAFASPQGLDKSMRRGSFSDLWA